MAQKYLLLLLNITCVCLFSLPHAKAQDNKALAKDFVEIADEIMNVTKAFIDARDQYVRAAELDPTNLRANYMAGELYLETINKERATQFYKQVYALSPNYKHNLLYSIGRGFQYGYEFDSAIVYYEKYKEKLVKDSGYRGEDRVSMVEVDRRIYESKNGKEFKANPENLSIVNIGKSINSEWDDYAPVLNEEEDLIIFTSRRKNGNLNENVDSDNFAFEDIFIAEKDGSEWQRASNIGNKVNTLYHDSNIALSKDGKELYLYKDENGGDIFVSRRNDAGEWSAPEPLSENINSSYAEQSVSISPDNTVLFFSSNRPGGIGGTDIYLSKRDSRGKWGKAVNLGDKINTPYDEEGPFIDFDGKTLYFSSRGHKGMGQYDIFKSEYDSAVNEWTEPVNLGYPINTPDNDIYFVGTKDGKRGYYASVREDGMGYMDIYMVTVPEHNTSNDKLASRKKKEEEKQQADQSDKVQAIAVTEKPVAPEVTEEDENTALAPFTLVIRVEDNLTSELLDAKVSLKSEGDRREMVAKRVEEGLYEFSFVNEAPTVFMLSAEKSGYMFKNFRINIPASGETPVTLKRKVELDLLEKGFSSILRNIYFDFDKATFTISSYNELNKLEQLLSENPGMKVEISGHTDNIGKKAYNQYLSKSRANAVVNYLVEKGIDTRRLSAAGYGEAKPLASNDDEKEGRELNRRVEFEVIER